MERFQPAARPPPISARHPPNGIYTPGITQAHHPSTYLTQPCAMPWFGIPAVRPSGAHRIPRWRRPMFKQVDFSLINLESAIAPGDASAIQQKQGGIYLQGHPGTVPALKSIGATVWQLHVGRLNGWTDSAHSPALNHPARAVCHDPRGAHDHRLLHRLCNSVLQFGAGPSSPPSAPLLPPSYCSVLPGSLPVHILSSRRYASPHTTSKH